MNNQNVIDYVDKKYEAIIFTK